VFYCPITKKLLEDLVVIPAGRMTYEWVAIEPQGDIPVNKLYPNRAF
jgi:hypothetical protein